MEDWLKALAAVPDQAWVALRLVVILLLALVLIRVLRRLVTRLEGRKLLSHRGAWTLRGTARAAVGVLALLLMAEQVGLSTASIWAAISAIAVMVAVGFVAVWSVLSNALCGLLLLVYAPFRLGDEIELVDLGSMNALRGRVTDMNLIFVQLAETSDGDEFVTQVPNNHFFQRGVRRKTRARKTQPLEETFTIGKNDALSKASGAPELTAERADAAADSGSSAG